MCAVHKAVRPYAPLPTSLSRKDNSMSSGNSTVTIERIRQILNYNKETGIITWSKDSGIRWAGCMAGSVYPNGYRRIEIDGKRFAAHRLAWVIVNGTWPELHIDHINGIRDDNRIGNLRLATSGQNSQNIRAPLSSNKHGFLGVKNNKGRWVATISVNRNFMYLGSFATPELAHEEYLKAKRHVHKFCTI